MAYPASVLSFSVIMNEFTYEFGALSNAGEKEEEKQRDKASEWCPGRLFETLKKIGHVLLTPVNDCRHRSYPRVVPDYSFLVLISCVANPILGALVCFLHRRAKRLFHKGEKGRADVLYLLVFALALLSVVSTLLCVALVGSYHLILNFSEDNIQRSKPPKDCNFRAADDQKIKELNLSRNDYCRMLWDTRGMGVANTLEALIKSHFQSPNKSAV